MEEGRHHKYTLFKCKFYLALTGYIVLACLCSVGTFKKIHLGAFPGDQIKSQAVGTYPRFSLRIHGGAQNKVSAGSKSVE